MHFLEMKLNFFIQISPYCFWLSSFQHAGIGLINGVVLSWWQTNAWKNDTIHWAINVSFVLKEFIVLTYHFVLHDWYSSSNQ